VFCEVDQNKLYSIQRFTADYVVARFSGDFSSKDDLCRILTKWQTKGSCKVGCTSFVYEVLFDTLFGPVYPGTLLE